MSLINRTRRNLVREQLTVGWRQLEPDRPSYSWWQRLLFIVFIVGLFWLGWWLFYSPRFQISKVTVEGVKRLDPAQIQRAAAIEKENIFRLKTTTVVNRLSDQTEITDVELVRVLPQTVRLVVTERAPEFVWKTTDNWYLVDQKGIVFRQITFEQLNNEYSYLPRVLDVANVQVNINEPVVPRTFVQAFINIKEVIPKIFPDQTDYYEVSETVYDFDLVLKNGKRIRFNILSNVSQQLASLEQLATKRPDLLEHSYLDLRVERWAYIR